MDVARQHELDLGDPLLDSLGLGLGPFVVLLEIIGEVAVEVESASIVPAKWIEHIKMTRAIGVQSLLAFLGRPGKCLLERLQTRPGSWKA